MTTVGNTVQITVDISPFTSILIIIRLNSEDVPKKISLVNKMEFFEVKYFKIDTDIRTNLANKKRYSWWNK